MTKIVMKSAGVYLFSILALLLLVPLTWNSLVFCLLGIVCLTSLFISSLISRRIPAAFGMACLVLALAGMINAYITVTGDTPLSLEWVIPLLVFAAFLILVAVERGRLANAASRSD